MDRKGEGGGLLKETFEIVLLAVGVLFLIIAVAKVWNVVGSDELAVAQTTIDNIQQRILAVPANEDGSFTVQGISKEWFLAGWGIKAKNPPDKCENTSCVCYCKGSVFDDAKKQCDTLGICKEVNEEEVMVKSKTPDKDNQQVIDTSFGIPHVIPGEVIDFIVLEKKLYEINIHKQNDVLTIYDTANSYRPETIQPGEIL